MSRSYSSGWFVEHLARVKRTPADLYHFYREEFGIEDRSVVSKMLNDKRQPQPRELPALLKWLRLDLDGVPEPEGLARPKVTEAPPDTNLGATSNFPDTGPRDVPVFQVVTGGDDGDFIFSDEPIDYVRRPYGLAGQKVLAAFVVGSSMSPRFEPGEHVYAYLGRPALPGDYVIVELHPSDDGGERQGYIKKLRRRSTKLIICEQFNPPGVVEFDAARVRAIYKIVPPNDLFG